MKNLNEKLVNILEELTEGKAFFAETKENGKIVVQTISQYDEESSSEQPNLSLDTIVLNRPRTQDEIIKTVYELTSYVARIRSQFCNSSSMVGDFERNLKNFVLEWGKGNATLKTADIIERNFTVFATRIIAPYLAPNYHVFIDKGSVRVCSVYDSRLLAVLSPTIQGGVRVTSPEGYETYVSLNNPQSLAILRQYVLNCELNYGPTSLFGGHVPLALQQVEPYILDMLHLPAPYAIVGREHIREVKEDCKPKDNNTVCKIVGRPESVVLIFDDEEIEVFPQFGVYNVYDIANIIKDRTKT